MCVKPLLKNKWLSPKSPELNRTFRGLASRITWVMEAGGRTGLKGASSVPEGCCSLTFIVYRISRTDTREKRQQEPLHCGIPNLWKLSSASLMWTINTAHAAADALTVISQRFSPLAQQPATQRSWRAAGLCYRWTPPSLLYLLCLLDNLWQSAAQHGSRFCHMQSPGTRDLQ